MSPDINPVPRTIPGCLTTAGQLRCSYQLHGSMGAPFGRKTFVGTWQRSTWLCSACCLKVFGFAGFRVADCGAWLCVDLSISISTLWTDVGAQVDRREPSDTNLLNDLILPTKQGTHLGKSEQ